ncbi:MAG: restriction endonuclease subunit S [Clostridium sp.]
MDNYLYKSKFIEMFGDPVSNPMNWNKKRLADECNIITGNTPSRKVEAYYGDYIEWIKSDNITGAGIYLSTAREYLSEVGLKVGRCVEENSILMTCIAGSVKCIGNVAVANRKVAFNQQINGIEPLKNNVFFMLQQFNLSQKYIQSTINMSLKGILSKGQLSELEFIFPPIEKQNEFAEFFKQVDKLKFDDKELAFKSLKMYIIKI